MKQLPQQWTLSRAKKEAWNAFSAYIKHRDNYTCFTCGRKGKGSGLHTGHFYPKKIGGVLLRFNELNCHAQCYTCNRHFDGMGMLYSLNHRKKYGSHSDQLLLQKVPESKQFKANRMWYVQLAEWYRQRLDDAQQQAERDLHEAKV